MSAVKRKDAKAQNPQKQKNVLGKNMDMSEQFISEAIEPDGSSFDTAAMATGAPGLPGRFRWRDRDYAVRAILKQWKESGLSRTGCGEHYLRKHWYKIQTVDGTIMTLYFERQKRDAGVLPKRWWLYTIEP